MRLTRSLLVLCALALACGKEDKNGDGIADGIRAPDTITGVAPASPVGTISGQVLDTHFQPLSGAEVTIGVGDPTNVGTTNQKVQTDANGWYFAKVPAGAQVPVSITKGGYGSVRGTTGVPSGAGNVPLNNGNGQESTFLLTNLSGSIKFLVVTSNGRPAKGARATLEANPAGTELYQYGSSGYGEHRGVTVVDAQADDQGVITFSGIPTPEEMARLNGLYLLHVNAYDENGDGIIDSTGYNNAYSGDAMVVDNSTHLVQLSNVHAGQMEIIATNVPSLTGDRAPMENMLRPGDSIYIAFSQTIQPNSVEVRLADETGTQLLAQTATVGATGLTLNIQPSAALESGKKYNIEVRAASGDTNGGFFTNSTTATGFFYGGDPASPKAFALTSVTFKDTNNDTIAGPGEVIHFNFNQPIGGFPTFSPPALQVAVNRDVGSCSTQPAGTVGDCPGEIGYAGTAPSPFVASIADPPDTDPNTPRVMPVTTSGYSSQYRLVVPATLTAWSLGTQFEIQFGNFTSTATGYQTTWEQPITTTVGGAGTGVLTIGP